MKRKTLSRETVPSKKTTNGGNGSYMRRSIMQDQQRGGRPLSAKIAPNMTATSKAVLKS